MDNEEKAWLALLSMIGEITKELRNIRDEIKLFNARNMKEIKPEFTPKETVKEIYNEFVNESIDGEQEEQEEVLMDLKDVQCVAITDMAMLVTKKGFQKWIPFSQIEGGKPKEKIDGKYFEDIPLTPQAENWIHKKKWDIFQVI